MTSNASETTEQPRQEASSATALADPFTAAASSSPPGAAVSPTGSSPATDAVEAAVAAREADLHQQQACQHPPSRDSASNDSSAPAAAAVKGDPCQQQSVPDSSAMTGHEAGDGPEVDTWQQHWVSEEGLCELPTLTVSDMTPEVFRLVLEFVYTGSVQILAPCWLKASGAELLFEAAERYLLPLLKVLPHCSALLAPWHTMSICSHVAASISPLCHIYPGLHTDGYRNAVSTL